MYIIKLHLSGLLTLLLLAGCTKTKHPDDAWHYRYFPSEEGHWVIYEVDSTAYNLLVDTVITYSYRVRETVGESYNDLTGTPWNKVWHEVMRDTSSGVWSAGPTGALMRSKRTAEKLEQNHRFIKLTFPIKRFATWHGNSYIHYDDEYNCNYLGNWNYRYTDVFVSRQVGALVFDSVVVIQQVADSGLVCKNVAIEWYAPGIGMIYRHQERLATQNTSPLPWHEKAEWGHILTYRIIGWK
jgi:hypothetical protein